MWVPQTGEGEGVSEPLPNAANGANRGITTYGLIPMWNSMIRSCEDPAYFGYEYYGGAGVRVCEQWKDFKKFRKWARANGGRKGLVIVRTRSEQKL